ncbi:MAG: 5-oxoprolinase subunit B family protein [Acidimicrobiales bacterium]
MKFLPVGPRALLVELDGGQAVLDLYEEIQRRRESGWPGALVDVVPAARTVLLDGLDDPARVASDLRDWRPARSGARAGHLVAIPTAYDGPDLEEVAHRWDMTTREVVATHVGTEFHVAFCGFAPGFAYLAGLPATLAVPRRASPRAAVPAGAVGLAGEYSAVYPRASPGGWQLIGRTAAVLWDLAREPPAVLTPGTRVNFVEVGP